MELPVLTLLYLLLQAFAGHGKSYKGSPPIKEVFDYNDRSYLLYYERVNWEEANAICKSNHGVLAIPDDIGKASFLAQSISEAWAPFEDMWIGGQKGVQGWQWASSGKEIPEQTREDDNYSFLYPPWIDGRLPERYNRDCLAIDRNGHTDPLFVDLECSMARPFICEIAHDDNKKIPVLAKEVEIFGQQYLLYNGKLSWDEAVAFCRENGYSLASVKNITIAKTIASAMLKARPAFESLWIGAQFKNNRWSWIADSEEMAVSEGYPPWIHTPKTGKNCVMLDRHIGEIPKFIDVMCTRIRDFVCMKNIDSEVIDTTKSTPIRYKNSIFTIRKEKVTWEQGRRVCESMKGGRMLELKDADEVNFLMQEMVNNNQDIGHVWLGGLLMNDEWVWIYNESEIPQADSSGFPPWCDYEKNPEMNCLNLDRQNHMTPLMYGLECNASQSVICVQDSLPVSKKITVGTKILDAVYSSVTGNRITWTQALKTCRYDTGSMLKDVDLTTLKEIVKELGAGRYFISAKMTAKGKAMWIGAHHRSVFDLPDLPLFDPSKVCLFINVEGEAGQSVLESIGSVACDELMNYSYICEETCDNKFDQNVENKAKWKCDWSQGIGLEERLQGKHCWYQCDWSEALLGSYRITCTPAGWIGAHNTSSLPVCLPMDSALKFVSDLQHKENGAIFIVDNSKTVTDADFKVFMYFVASVISSFGQSGAGPSKRWIEPVQKQLAFSVFMMRDGKVSVLNIGGDNPCDAISDLNTKLKISDELQPSGYRDFAAAFHYAKNWVQNGRNVPVYFISTGRNQGQPYQDLLRQLKTKVKGVVAIGVQQASASHDEMAEIATVHQDKVNAVTFRNSSYLRLAVDNLYNNGACVSEITDIKNAAQGVEVHIEMTASQDVTNVKTNATTAMTVNIWDQGGVTTRATDTMPGTTVNIWDQAVTRQVVTNVPPQVETQTANLAAHTKPKNLVGARRVNSNVRRAALEPETRRMATQA